MQDSPTPSPAAEAHAGHPILRRLTDSRRAPMLGLALSLTVHAVLLVILAFILLDRPGGSGGAGDGIELAIVTQADLSALEAAAAASAPAIDAQTPAQTLDPTAFDAAVPDAGLEDAASSLAGLEGAGDSAGEGVDLGAGAGAGSASFFGVEARGTRFAYVVDVSGSMNGPKIETLRRELASSLLALDDHASYVVVFFSSAPRVLGGQRRWTKAGDRTRDFAVRQIAAIEPGGATNPLPALEIVFEMRPRPDAIYFMTDGQFSDLVVQEASRLNGAWIEPIPIHTISFVSDEGRSQLERIARDSGGTYTHVPGARP